MIRTWTLCVLPTFISIAKLRCKIDLLPHLRVNKNSNGHWVRIDPGPDRLVINTQCDIIGAFSDYEYKFDTQGGRVEACTLIRSRDDVFGSPSVETPP